MRDQWRQIAAALGMMAVVAVGNRMAQADDEPNGPRVQRLSEALFVPLDGQHYRIGIKCAPASETLHAQLPDLPKDQGLVVEEVIAKSPAEKAGIKEHDILLMAGDKPLAQPADLTGLIEAGKGSELSIKLLRGGKPISVTVKPEEAKSFADRLQLLDLSTGLNISEPSVEQNGKSLNLTNSHELPADLSVNIYREGKKPAKITVKKGSHTWEVTENELDKLPEDIRREVEPLVGGPLRINLKDLEAPVTITGPTLGDVFSHKRAELEDRVEQRIDEMNKRLDEMRSKIGEMRSKIDQLGNDHKGQEPRSEK